MESFFGTLETELVNAHPVFLSCQAAKAAVFDYIEVFYNRRRMHSRLGYVSPVVYEEQHRLGQAA